MFDYTVTAAKKIYEDFKKFGRVCDVITQILYIAYLTYSVFAQTGRWWIKAVLLGISVGYFIFYIVTQCSKKYQLGKRGKRVFKWSKLGLKLFEKQVELGEELAERVPVIAYESTQEILYRHTLSMWQ